MGHAQQLLARYSVEANKHYRDSSMKVYGAILGKLEQRAREAGETLMTVSPRTIERFLSEQAHPTTAKRYATFLHDVYRFLQQHGDIAYSPAHDLRDKYSYQEPVARTDGFITQEQQDAFLQALPAPTNWKYARDAALLALAVGTGVKLKEAIRLFTQDVYLNQAQPSVLVHHGRGTREVPIRPATLPYLKTWQAMRDQFNLTQLREYFPASHRGGHLTPSAIYRLVRATLERAGLGSLTHLGLTSLRVSYARIEAAEGSAVGLLRHRLGHKHELSTLHLLGSSTK